MNFLHVLGNFGLGALNAAPQIAASANPLIALAGIAINAVAHAEVKHPAPGSGAAKKSTALEIMHVAAPPIIAMLAQGRDIDPDATSAALERLVQDTVDLMNATGLLPKATTVVVETKKVA